ncbi:MAG: UDP-N-acetyl-D-mannosamine dehydrogenase [SAR324 cluster bacterium]|uniref:UDP-N-acetyl-D-mannosamine dehydrogenase n=1 Tax=SAR324 cluster bacterium TaxID=2024889 RepID=A0A2A4SZ95_9DELT|nr:MAG: UDP-N-acetyl-D-mannosamine dehydrogenase [SAR324 cluster bacterium]
MINKLDICVLGLGYIGLPTASLLATKGFQVTGVDVRQEIVDIINQGNIHIVEPELDILVKSAVQSGHLIASLEPVAADIFILAVPTPFKNEYEPDLSYVEQATRKIAPYLQEGNIVILESTSPVGTTELVAEWIRETRQDDICLYIAHCPERVLPGQILKELIENDRVIGGVTPEATQKVAEFYRTFISGRVLETNARTAEMAKLVENSYRDVNIAFANELSLICDDDGVDVWELINLANHHPRVNILQPGPGVGGHCIAVDPWFIVHRNPQKAKIIKMARLVNESKPNWVIEKVKAKAERFKKPVIACLGLAYKNDIDDLRESPALRIAVELQEANVGQVIACEPNVEEGKVKGISVLPLREVLHKADIILLLVKHKEFLDLNFNTLQEKVIIDTCGIIGL